MSTNAISENHELWKAIVLELVLALLGKVSAKVRGIGLNFEDGTVSITVYFDGEPSDRDAKNMQEAEAELISHHEYQSDLALVATASSESIFGREGNWGWVFLRDES